jgi:hypothetical protein
VVAYPLDGSAHDIVAGNTATLDGPSATANRFGRASAALRFDASKRQAVVMPANSKLPKGSGARTLSLWVRTSAPKEGDPYYQTLATWGPFVSDQRFGISTYGPNSMFTGQDDDLRDKTVVRDGGWHHLAATFDGTTAKLYVDGAPVLSGDKPKLATADQNLALGAKVDSQPLSDADEFLDGDLDDVRIFDVALSPAQIRAIYEQSDVGM